MSQTSQVIYCKSQQAKKTTAKGFTFHSYLKSCKTHRADINFAIVRTADRWTDKSQRQVERVGEEGDQKDWGTSRRNRGTWITQASNGLSELILTITLSLSHTHTPPCLCPAATDASRQRGFLYLFVFESRSLVPFFCLLYLCCSSRLQDKMPVILRSSCKQQMRVQ